MVAEEVKKSIFSHVLCFIVQTPRGLWGGVSSGAQILESLLPCPHPQSQEGTLSGGIQTFRAEELFKQLPHFLSVYLCHGYSNLFSPIPVCLSLPFPTSTTSGHHAGLSLGFWYQPWPLVSPLQLKNEPAAEDGTCGYGQRA